jgi:uncharacterized protein YgiM (DUF1202 family)
MEQTRIDSFCQKFRQRMLPLKNLTLKALSTKPGMIGLAAVLVLVLTIALTTCSRNEPTSELADATTQAQMEVTKPATEPTAIETQPVGIPATMGTIIIDQLSICKDPGIVVDIEAYYTIGDRVEIQQEMAVNGTAWGYTGKGWIDMSYVRMDDVPSGRDNSTNSDGVEIVSNGSHAVLGYGVVDLKTLNVRIGPGTDYTKIKEIPQGTRYAYYEVADEWVRIGDGWVSTLYFYVEGTTAEDATTGTVTTNDLNVRTGPDTSFQRISSYMENDSVQILAIVNDWGYTEKGWISMMYVNLPEPVYATGSATVTIGLNIREEPDPSAEKVDAYQKGDRVTILEVNDGWGKTNKGWINLDYVKYDQ